MAARKRPASSISNSDAVILKRPVHAPKSRQTEYQQRVRSVCAGTGCDKRAQIQHNGLGYCKICIKIVQPELAAEALELRAENEAKRSRHSCYGAPEHRPCTAVGQTLDPVSQQYYRRLCLRIVSLEMANSIIGDMRVVRDSRGCYY